MRAVVLRAPGDLAVQDIATPAAGPDEVLVRVAHSGICGTDLKIFSGGMPAPYPIVMGHEISGDVVEGGGGRVAPGDRVLVDPVLYCGACADCGAGRTHLCRHGAVIGREVNGGFADFVVAPTTHVFPLPPSVETRVAPLIQVLTTVLHAQRRVTIAGQSVVVLGLGVSGQLHLQLAKALGARQTIGITRSAWKRGLADSLGAGMTIPAGGDAAQAVADATGGGADVVIETTGVVRSLADALAFVRPGGTVLLFGIYTATEAALPFYQLYYKEPTVQCARAARSEDFPASIDLVARGAVRLDPLVTQVLPVESLRDALGMIERDEDGRMKVILVNT